MSTKKKKERERKESFGLDNYLKNFQNVRSSKINQNHAFKSI